MSHESAPFLTLMLGGQHYALPIDQVVEVVAMVELTHTNDPRPAVLGVANRHEAVLPMLDLRVMLGHPAAPLGAATLFVVVKPDDQCFGLVVDAVNQVEYLPAEKSNRGIISYDERLIQIIALEPLLSSYAG